MEFEKAKEMAEFFKVIADETRVRILYLLEVSEYNVQEIANSLDMSHSAISHQLSKLKQYRLVKAKRVGKEMYYSLDDDHIHSIFNITLEHLEHR